MFTNFSSKSSLSKQQIPRDIMLRRILLFVLILTLSATTIGSTLISHQDKAQAQHLGILSEWGLVNVISVGWGSMAVYHSAPLVNPDDCSVTNGGYTTNPNDPDHSLFHTILLNAFMNKKEVQLLIRDCVNDKPQIIGVNIR